MKKFFKFIFSLIISFCLFGSISGEVLIASATPTVTASDWVKVERVNDIYLVTPENMPQGASVIFACYKEGRMVYLNEYAYNNESVIPFYTSEEFDEVKVFVWDSLEGTKPLKTKEYVTAEITDISMNLDNITICDAENNSIDIPLNVGKTYNIFIDNEKTTVDELGYGDIVSIIYDATVAGTTIAEKINNSLYLDIYVSTDTKIGKLTERNYENRTIEIDSQTYELVPRNETRETFELMYKINDEYRLYIDIFGKVFKTKNITPIDYAVVTDFVWDEDKQDYILTLYTDKGELRRYMVDSDITELIIEKSDGTKTEVSGDGSLVCESLYEAIYLDEWVSGKSGTLNELKNVENRVVTYKTLSDATTISFIEFLYPSATASSASDFYNAETEDLGEVLMNTSTKIVDACEYIEKFDVSNLSLIMCDYLCAGYGYTAYAYGERARNYGDYPFVVVTSGLNGYDDNSRFAIVLDCGAVVIDETGKYEYLVDIEALYNGEKVTLYSIPDVKDEVRRLKFGEAFLFKTEANGYIDCIDKIFSSDMIDNRSDNKINLADCVENMPLIGYTTEPVIAELSTDNFPSRFTKEWDVSGDSIQLLFGPILSSDDNSFLKMGKIINNETDMNTDVLELKLSDDMEIYSCSIDEEDNLDEYNFDTYYDLWYYYRTENTIDWTYAKDYCPFAFVLAVDGVAVQVFQFF